MIYTLPECTLTDCTICPDLNPELVAEYFLKESNLIEGVTDDDSLQQALHAWEYLISEDKLTAGVILKLHKILMLHDKDLQPNERGYWRTKDVFIGREEILGITPDGTKLIKQFVKTADTLDWRAIPDSIKQWLYVESRVVTAQWPEEWIKQSHIQYERIHPFIDGNGRTGRMLLNWRRLKLGLPLLVIHNDEKAEKYYKWFKLDQLPESQK